jgi:VWFA-related protein
MKPVAIFIGLLCIRVQAQQPPVFKSETKVVMIDAVVTGKKGEYVPDLTAKDFRIWEDNKEQTIQSFALESNSSHAEPSRMVLFFDDAGMSAADEATTRQAAARFVDANVASNRLMAVANFDGDFRVAQGFTNNAGKLKEALQTLNLASSSPNGPARFGGPPGHQPKGINPGSVTARGLIQSVGNLAQNLNAVPGRKIVVLFTSETSLSPLQSGDLVGLAQICNRSNVAVYPVLPLVVQEVSENPIGPVGLVRPGIPGPNSPAIPDVQPDANIAVTIAKGTGGFVVPTSNDLVAELGKLGPEQSQYYVLGYTPHDSKEGACHTLRVRVNRKHADVRARSGYCAAKPQDLLAESTIEQDLEKHASAPQTDSDAAMQAPFFYVTSNVAQVHVALEIPAKGLKVEKQKGKLHAELNILGIAKAPNGNLAARFSDIVERNFDSEQDLERFEAQPLHYEKEFKIIPGRYTLTAVFDSGGTSFGKAEMPLAIDR